MRRILISTTALSVALTQIASAPVFAQTLTEDGSVIGEDGSVLCLGTVDAPCDLNAVMEALAAQKAAEEAAAAEAAAQAEAEAQAAAEAEAAAQAEAEAAAAAEAEAAAQAAAEAEAQRAAEEAAAAEAAAQAEAEAAAQAEAEAQAAAAAEAAALAEAEAQKAAEEAAAAEAAAQAEAEAQRAAEEAATAEAAAQEEAAPAEEAALAEEPSLDDAMEQILTEEPAAEPAQDETITAPEAVDPEAAVQEPADTATEEPAAEPEAATEIAPEAVAEQPADAVTDAAVAAEADAAIAEEPVVGADGQPLQTFVAEQPADLIDPAATEVPAETAIETLSTLLAGPDAGGEVATEAPQTEAAAALVEATEGQPVQIVPAEGVEDVVVQEITEDTARSSGQDFTAPASANLATAAAAASSRDDGLTDLQKFGLVALGALAVGAIINANRDQVVSNTGDRVVVRRGDGDYYVYKDDDALLRRPGSTVRTETFRDGSTRTIVERGDGSQIVTIRDATGRVLRRATYDSMGREIVLIDDLYPEERIDVSTLPQPRGRVISMSTSEDEALLRARMAAVDARELGRTFSLRQIREIREVRQQAATVDVNNITFDTGSAAIKAEQAESLAALGRFMQAMIRENPNEIFLIEGHTDAVGPASLNLTLSDRRAESVALALTEYFDVPPENLVVQGYGESELRVPTQGAERQNRRVAVRIITPLLRSAELR